MGPRQCSRPEVGRPRRARGVSSRGRVRRRRRRSSRRGPGRPVGRRSGRLGSAGSFPPDAGLSSGPTSLGVPSAGAGSTPPVSGGDGVERAVRRGLVVGPGSACGVGWSAWGWASASGAASAAGSRAVSGSARASASASAPGRRRKNRRRGPSSSGCRCFLVRPDADAVPLRAQDVGLVTGRAHERVHDLPGGGRVGRVVPADVLAGDLVAIAAPVHLVEDLAAGGFGIAWSK